MNPPGWAAAQVGSLWTAIGARSRWFPRRARPFDRADVAGSSGVGVRATSGVDADPVAPQDECEREQEESRDADSLRRE